KGRDTRRPATEDPRRRDTASHPPRRKPYTAFPQRLGLLARARGAGRLPRAGARGGLAPCRRLAAALAILRDELFDHAPRFVVGELDRRRFLEVGGCLDHGA